ncbi:hypothetical protein NDA15_000327 [Ustilago hordei]|nr:hypothetical protein NDA15_000327 [Ustilago hordei]
MPLITPAMRRAPPQPPTSSPAVGFSSTTTLGPQSLPPLPTIPLTPETLGKIKEPLRLVLANMLAYPLPPSPSSTATNPFEKLIQLLHELNSWTDNIEPQAKPQRFGNLAFRDWGQRLSDRIDRLHEELLPERLHAFVPELKGYLGDAWGSFTRIDYGSGHELAFFAWVGFLYRLGFFTEVGKGEEEGETIADEAVEERIGLEIFPLYLLVVWRLQDRYGLEPAGSHGVWGLDDFQFLPYVLGAAQLRTQSSLRPSQIVPLSSQPLNSQRTAWQQKGSREAYFCPSYPTHLSPRRRRRKSGDTESIPHLTTPHSGTKKRTIPRTQPIVTRYRYDGAELG